MMSAQARQAERASEAGQETARQLEDTYSRATQGAIDYHRKVLEIAQANINATFECAQELLGVKSPLEFMEITSNHARQHVQNATEQTRELAALAQKTLVQSIEPLTNGFTSAFRGNT